ncbi:MAG: HPr family phosphocarrier protein [Endozoicomonas sp.]
MPEELKAVKKPVYSEKLICHHPTISNSQVLMALGRSMLRFEGYLNDSPQREVEQSLIGKHIVLNQIFRARETGIAAISCKEPTLFSNHKVSLYVTISVADDSEDHLPVLQRLKEWSADPLLTERISQADFLQIYSALKGDTLPNVAKEYVHHRFAIETNSEIARHYAKRFVTDMKKFTSRVEFRNVTKRSKFVNAKSYVNLLSLGLEKGTMLEMRALGPDSGSVMAGLEESIQASIQAYNRHLAH